MAILALFSCQDDKTVQNLNEKQESNNNGSKNNETSFVEGKIYRYYTISDKPEFAYMTSILLENETLKISESKIKATDIPEGNLTGSQLRINGIPTEDIYYNGQWVEFGVEANSMCEIPVGFSENLSNSKELSASSPTILSKSKKMKYYCDCKGDIGECGIKPTYAGNGTVWYECTKLSCTKCRLNPTSAKEENVNIPFGVIYTKAKQFVIVDKL